MGSLCLFIERCIMCPGGHAPKGRGTSYEYRVRNTLQQLGWDAHRNPLSGASEQVAETTGKHDVRASKNGIFLQIECKKTAEDKTHKLQRKWIGKIDFSNDEFLVFAFGRSPHYALVSEVFYKSLDPTFIATPRYTAAGGVQFTFHRIWLEEEEIVCFLWKDYNEIFIATELGKFISLLEKRGPLQALHPIDFINSATDIGTLTQWYKDNKHRLTNRERSHYYGKLHRLEHDIPDEVSPEFKASVQWWRDTNDDVIMKCPHCKELITYKQLKESREDGKKVSDDSENLSI